jgi:hypothetical protein
LAQVVCCPYLSYQGFLLVADDGEHAAPLEDGQTANDIFSRLKKCLSSPLSSILSLLLFVGKHVKSVFSGAKAA